MFRHALGSLAEINGGKHPRAILCHRGNQLSPPVTMVANHDRRLGAGEILDLVTRLGRDVSVVDVLLVIQDAEDHSTPRVDG